MFHKITYHKVCGCGYEDSKILLQGNHRASRTIKSHLTLAQAQVHCNSPKTRKEGIYFDGYTET